MKPESVHARELDDVDDEMAQDLAQRAPAKKVDVDSLQVEGSASATAPMANEKADRNVGSPLADSVRKADRLFASQDWNAAADAYRELLRRFPPGHLHESWLDYLYWDIELEA